MGIAIPTFFCILIQLSYILAKINSNFNVIFNLDTFTTIFLIFFASMFIVMVLKTKIKLGIIYGMLLGLIAGIVVLISITLLTLLTNPEVQLNQIINWNFGIYLIISTIFQMLTGAIGGFLGSKIANLIK